MTVEEAKVNDFSGGVNNVLPSNRVPDGAVRDALNLDPQGPTLALRTGYKKFLDAAKPRALASIAEQLVFVDGDQLKVYDLESNTTKNLMTVDAAGPVAHVTLNDELFLQTRNFSLRYDGHTLRDWGVPDVVSQPQVSVSEAGDEDRLLAMTWINDYGEEGGTVQPVIVPDGTYSITIPGRPGHKARIYISPPNAQTMYWQGDYDQGTTASIAGVSERGHPLETHGLKQPPKGHFLTTVGGIICIASDSNVFFTEPFMPHLYDPMKNFVQYPEKVGVLLGGLGGLYVSADKCYLLRGVETDSIEQRTVLEYPAVPGTGVITDSGRAAWVTEYGMAIEDESGQGVQEPNKGSFSPDPAESGSAGYVETSGRQLLVSSMKKQKGASGQLAAGDYFEAEVSKT